MDTTAARNDLSSLQLSASEFDDSATMTLTDSLGRKNDYQLNQDGLGALLHQVITFAAASWQNRPEHAIMTVNSIIKSFPSQQVVSMQAVGNNDVAIKINLGKVEMAFLIPC